MQNRSPKSSLVQVVCEACLALYEEDCIICAGQKFYLWDPTTRYCYLSGGNPMLYKNEEGRIVQVVRNHPANATPPSHISTEMMLTFIETWVAQNESVRKFKLSFVKEWECAVWKNRYSEKACIFKDLEAKRAIQTCYTYLLSTS